MRTPRLAVGLAIAVVALVGCSPVASAGTSEGVVVEVVGDLSSVEEFTISTGPGQTMTFVPDPDGDFAFPLPHLQDHLRSGAPVEVDWERRDETLWAVAIDDAGTSHHH